MINNPNKTRGFTLIEIAIVMMVIGLLMAAFLMPLDAQFQQTRVSEAREDLSEIKEALLGFASVNISLPCPDTTGDGIADACVGPMTNLNSTGGNIPWVTLGTKRLDPWNRPYQYRVNNAFTLSPIALTSTASPGQLQVCTTSACIASEANNVPAVIYSSGSNGAVQPPIGADELENTVIAGPTFNGVFVNHEFSPAAAAGGEFDDVMDWISTNVLLGRLVAAGLLP